MMAVNAPIEARYNGMLQAVRTISAKEGLTTLWRGMKVVFVMAGPAHAAYFCSYEAAKGVTGSYFGKHNWKGHCE